MVYYSKVAGVNWYVQKRKKKKKCDSKRSFIPNSFYLIQVINTLENSLNLPFFTSCLIGLPTDPRWRTIKGKLLKKSGRKFRVYVISYSDDLWLTLVGGYLVLLPRASRNFVNHVDHVMCPRTFSGIELNIVPHRVKDVQLSIWVLL